MATVKLDPAKGVQIPNLTTTERNAISSPETGALIWNTTTSAINQYNGSAWEITYTDTNTQVAGITSSADATAITIDSSENVGIGTTAPAAKIDIEDTLQATANQHYSLVVGGGSGSDTVGNSSSILLSTTQGVTRGSSISAEKANVGNGHNLIFSTSASTAAPTEAMRINSAGRVGIGTTQMNNGLNLPQGTGDDNRIGWSDGGGTRRGTIGVSSANDDMEFRIGSSSTLKVSVSSDGLLFNGDTAAANALDDYEEGTWSPTLIGATFANQTTTGRYVKIGNIVHIQYYTAAFNISSASGAARISNLPYAPLNVSGHHSVINYAHGTAVTGAAHIYLDHSNATMYFVTNDTTSSASWTNGNSKYVMISGTYQTA